MVWLKAVEMDELRLFLVIASFSHLVTGENYLAMESSLLVFKCKTKVTPIWLENLKTKSITMAYGTEKRTTFNNNR